MNDVDLGLINEINWSGGQCGSEGQSYSYKMNYCNLVAMSQENSNETFAYYFDIHKQQTFIKYVSSSSCRVLYIQLISRDKQDQENARRKRMIVNESE